MKKIILYDFDGTLTPYSMPKFEILKICGRNEKEFLKQVKNYSKDKEIDIYEALYEVYFEIIKKAGFKLTNDNIVIGYNNVEYNNKVREFLNMLCENDIKNYLLSSGIKVFLEKVIISKYFTDIYATTFNYDENEEVSGINFLMSDKNKVIAIKDIMKKNNLSDCKDMIYIGDGVTDYYAMEYIKNNGGVSIFVYNDEINDKERMENVVDLFTKNDFENNKELSNYIKKLCNIK